MTRTLVLVDYGGGNIRSVEKAFEAIDIPTIRSADPDVVARAPALVMPGVGAFGDMMAALERRGLVAPLRDAARDGRPLLGICVGLQILFEVGEEMGEHPGLGILPGRVRRFETEGLKVPHIGWNRILPRRAHPLLDGIDTGAYAYFVHSYHPVPEREEDVIAGCDYGGEFPAICGRGRVIGIQFHPEKSQRVGLRILENFARWCGLGGDGERAEK